jgi:plastocyanin
MRRSFWIVTVVALALIGTGCGNSSSPSTPSPTPSGTPVSIVAGSSTLTTTAYNPNPVTIQRGGTVTWVNNDNTAHTSTSESNVWNSQTIAPGGSFSMTFSNPGTFPYHCTIHPGMIGAVTVQ